MVDSQFPMSKWDQLTPYEVITLNLLCSSCLHPSLSAYASLFGNYDYNGIPLGPPGTRVVAHIAADTRASFAPHGRVGWYIGPAPEHYRCHHIYFPGTIVECDVLKMGFPWENSIPSRFSHQLSRQTAQDLLHLLYHPTSRQSSLLSFGSPIHNAFTEVATILDHSCLPPSSNIMHHATPLRVPFWNISRSDPSPAVYPTTSKGEHSLVPCPTVLHPTTITHAQLWSAWPKNCWQDFQSLYRPSWNNWHSSCWYQQANLVKITCEWNCTLHHWAVQATQTMWWH